MNEFRDVSIGDLFVAKGGRATFTRDYIDRHPGTYPVYSASLVRPFGMVDTSDYDGEFLTWVMNGYGGRVQIVNGRFSATRDRGVFAPRPGVRIPDLNYLRFIIEPRLVAAAVGRRVDGRANDYTKIYPDEAMAETVRLRVHDGDLDYPAMELIGAKLRQIAAAQALVRASREALAEATFALSVDEPTRSVSLGDAARFALSIGKRVKRNEHTPDGKFAAYSANVRVPFGYVDRSNLTDFSKASLLWGIDGVFDWNLIEPGIEFATTDHCGRLQIADDTLDPEFVYWSLRLTRARYGFDRVYRANLDNLASEVSVTVPTETDGTFSLRRQQAMAATIRNQERARIASLAAIDDVLGARLSPDAVALA